VILRSWRPDVLVAGVLLVVVSLQWERAGNARCVVQAVAGVRLDRDRRTPMRLRKAVQRVLEDPFYRQRARTLATALASHRGPARAAAPLEQLGAGLPAPSHPAATEA
jgi:UDP:flavonoid glycosyltransferase YjiC (YdhE family)